jgi:hypothetical protein
VFYLIFFYHQTTNLAFSVAFAGILVVEVVVIDPGMIEAVVD